LAQVTRGRWWRCLPAMLDAHATKWIGVPLALHFLVVIVGMVQFKEKWFRAPGESALGFRNLLFAATPGKDGSEASIIAPAGAPAAPPIPTVVQTSTRPPMDAPTTPQASIIAPAGAPAAPPTSTIVQASTTLPMGAPTTPQASTAAPAAASAPTAPPAPASTAQASTAPPMAVPTTPQPSTPSQKTPQLQRCDTEEEMDKPPCYRLLYYEIYFGGFFISGFPLLPVTLGIVLGCLTDGGFSRFAKAGLRRAIVYIIILFCRYLLYQTKRILTHAVHGLDASDHLVAYAVDLFVAFREVAFMMKLDRKRTLGFASLACAIVVWITCTYFSYFTARFFHTRLESVCGILVGLSETMILCWLTTGEHPYVEGWVEACKLGDCDCAGCAFTYDESDEDEDKVYTNLTSETT